MSDHPREAVRHLNRLNVCNDVWYNVFPFVGHTTLGLGLALCNWRFNVLVDRYLENAKWAIGSIEICRAAPNVNGMEIRANGKLVPTAGTPLPRQIVGFKYILISYIDHTVLAFLRRIEPIVGTKIALNVHIELERIRGWHALRLIWPVLCNSISFLTLDSNQLSGLQLVTSTTVLSDCANLRGIEFHRLSYFNDHMDDDWDNDVGMDGGDGDDIIAIDEGQNDEFVEEIDQHFVGILANFGNYAADGNWPNEIGPQVAADHDQPHMEVDQQPIQQMVDDDHPPLWPCRALFQWLHNGREDGQPKLLKYVHRGHITPFDLATLREAFLENRSSPISYIIRLEAFVVDIEPFELENQSTREVLVLRRFFDDLWLLERGPVGRGESACDSDRVALKCGWEDHQNGMINVALYGDRDVGHLSAQQPSLARASSSCNAGSLPDLI